MNFNAYNDAHPSARHLVNSWYARAHQSANERDIFEAFIYLWMSFNAWAMRVTKADTDAKMIRALSRSKQLNEYFNQLIQSSPLFREQALGFSEYWPIFSVLDLEKKGLLAELFQNNRSRAAVRDFLLAENVRCGPKGDFDRNNPTWGTAIPAIYQVRCNLFHGNKGNAADDFGIVEGGFHVLLGVIESANLYR